MERGRVFNFGIGSAADWFEETGAWDKDRAVLGERAGRRKWKGTAVGDDGRVDVVGVLLDISASEKRRILVSDSSQGEVGRLVVFKGVDCSSL